MSFRTDRSPIKLKPPFSAKDELHLTDAWLIPTFKFHLINDEDICHIHTNFGHKPFKFVIMKYYFVVRGGKVWTVWRYIYNLLWEIVRVILSFWAENEPHFTTQV